MVVVKHCPPSLWQIRREEVLLSSTLRVRTDNFLYQVCCQYDNSLCPSFLPLNSMSPFHNQNNNVGISFLQFVWLAICKRTLCVQLQRLPDSIRLALSLVVERDKAYRYQWHRNVVWRVPYLIRSCFLNRIPNTWWKKLHEITNFAWRGSKYRVRRRKTIEEFSYIYLNFCVV